MLGLRWGGHRAGALALATAAVVAGIGFSAPPSLLAVALGRGAFLSLYILYIVWPALLLYHVVDEAGGIRDIGISVAGLTRNHIVQLLILGVAFTTFLQGVAGFGVPVAVVAPLLLGMGFPAQQATAAALVGHAWAVSLGDMASSFQALRAVTDLPGHELGLWTAGFLSLCGLLTAFAVAHIHGGFSAIRRWPGPTLILGLATAGTQLLLAYFDYWILATFGAGLVGLVVGLGLTKLRRYQGPSRPAELPPKPEAERVRPVPLPPSDARMGFHTAFAAYYILVGVVLAATLIPPVHQSLSAAVFTLTFPETRTGLGWVQKASTATFTPLAHPGTLLLCTAVLAWGFYRAQARWPSGRAPQLLRALLREAIPTSLGILAMVMTAMIMTASGMTFVLARGVVTVTGPAYPLAAPLIGLLGCFITGSNTSSNILFGPLQMEAARLLAAPPVVLAAAQSAGGALGSMVSPAKVLVACATVGLSRREGAVLARVLPYCLLFTLLVGGLAWLLIARGPGLSPAVLP